MIVYTNQLPLHSVPFDYLSLLQTRLKPLKPLYTQLNSVVVPLKLRWLKTLYKITRVVEICLPNFPNDVNFEWKWPNNWVMVRNRSPTISAFNHSLIIKYTLVTLLRSFVRSVWDTTEINILSLLLFQPLKCFLIIHKYFTSIWLERKYKHGTWFTPSNICISIGLYLCVCVCRCVYLYCSTNTISSD